VSGTQRRQLVMSVAVLLLCRAAYAGETNQLVPGDPRAAAAVVPIPQPEPRPEPSRDYSRFVAGLVLGSGVVTIAVGTFIALKYTHNVVGSEEDNLVGLGIACAGVPIAMVGTMLWFNLPHTATQISLAPSGFALAGRF
jgi:hypothetical protein